MTHVCNTFNDYATMVEKAYTIEVVDFDGYAQTIIVYAYNANDAQREASEIVGNVDYTSVLFAEVIK